MQWLSSCSMTLCQLSIHSLSGVFWRIPSVWQCMLAWDGWVHVVKEKVVEWKLLCERLWVMCLQTSFFLCFLGNDRGNNGHIVWTSGKRQEEKGRRRGWKCRRVVKTVEDWNDMRFYRPWRRHMKRHLKRDENRRQRENKCSLLPHVPHFNLVYQVKIMSNEITCP